MRVDDTARALSALHALDPGTNRETWIRTGMAAKSAGLTLDDFREWSRKAPNFGSDRECATAWRSFQDGPIKAGTLYAMASSAGWEDPRRTRHNGQVVSLPTIHRGHVTRRPKKASGEPTVAPLKLWKGLEHAPDSHPYIVAKRGRADGLRVVPAGDPLRIDGHSVAGWLVVPALSPAGELRTLQFIAPSCRAKKLNLGGAPFRDWFFVVGDLAQSPRVYIVEGIGQAWACWCATGCASVVCFGAGRMSDVAEALRRLYPELPLVLVPDRGKETRAATIARAMSGE